MVMASSPWAEAVKAGREEGRQQGTLAEARAFCAELTREHHPKIADRVVPLIDVCPDVERLHEWGLQGLAALGRRVPEARHGAGANAGQVERPRAHSRAFAQGEAEGVEVGHLISAGGIGVLEPWVLKSERSA
jgi:hypothetical protein